MTAAERTVREYLAAVGEGRLDELERYVHEDATFAGAGMAQLDGLPAIRAALGRLSPILERNEVQRVFVDGDEACVVYDFVTKPVGPVASVEWLRLRDGRISSTWLLFDKARWPEVMGALATPD